MKRHGFGQSIGIDHKVVKGASVVVLRLDLTAPEGVRLLWDLLHHSDTIMYIHCGPPCGTSSRARGIGPGPRALRSHRHPDGLPSLLPHEALRVRLANSLYQLVGQIAEFCSEKGIFFTCENPSRSWFWSTSFYSLHVRHLLFRSVRFDHCEFGSQRQKRTRLDTNLTLLDRLAQDCSGRHSHLPWGRTSTGWATAEEVAYPPELCKQWARAVVDELVELGAKPPSDELQQHGPDARTMRAQPRTKRLPPLVPPFTGAKLVRTIFLGGSGSAADSSGEHNLDEAGDLSSSNSRFDQLPEWVNAAMPCTAHSLKAETENEAVAGRKALQIFGIPWSPDEFIQQAALRKHPRDLVRLLPRDLSDVVECNSLDTAAACALGRTETIRRWAFKALELRAEDARLCAAAPEHCRETLSAKRPAMLKFLLDEIGYEDRDLPQQLLTGFDLTGPVPVSNVFRPRIRPATITRDELRAHAGRLREATLSSIRSSGDPLVDRELYKVTCEEVRKGWLRGPFKESDIPSHSSVSRRFPVVQHGKVRPIDDMAASCINMATATAEAISVHNCDVVVGLAVSLMRADSNRQSQQLLLRSWDLSKAYKQFAISLESLDDAYIALFRPGGGHEIYQAVVLPFGSVASVNNFVRCAFAAWSIGVRALKLPWCVYFDDYVCFAWESVANHTAMIVRALFSFIGFQTADDKDGVFGAVCIVLGLEVSIGPWDRAIVKVSNTEDRKLKLSAAISQVLEDGKIKPSHWETLKGRLQFAEAQIWGRGAAVAMKTLRRHLDGARRVFEANEAVRASLEWIRDRILLAPPRQLAAKEMPVRHIYVDACYESSSDLKAGLGGILMEGGKCLAVFSYFMTNAQLQRVANTGSKNPIYELEAFAVAVALSLWHKRLCGFAPVVFTDNNAALGSFISNKASLSGVEKILQFVYNIEVTIGSLIWFERVCSFSNPADAPSRGEVPEQMKTLNVQIDINAVLEECSL